MESRLTVEQIDNGVQRFLLEAYATATISDNPELIYVCAGPGAGKTSVKKFLKLEFKKKGEKPIDASSDRIAEYHPNYEEIVEELPEKCYSLTRQFVKPALPKIYKKLRDNRISIISEKTFSRGADIEEVKQFKDAGYKVFVSIMATNIFESRLSCYEREAFSLRQGVSPRGCSIENQIRMHTSFIKGIRDLQREGLIDGIKVYIRGKNINKPPILRYSSDDEYYINFEEVINREEDIQIKKIFENMPAFILRIEKARRIISEYGQNENLTQNALEGLNQLQDDLIRESAEYLKNKKDIENREN